MSNTLSLWERHERFNSTQTKASSDFRSQSRKDRDRLRYTREFRRLKNVTQVARANESSLYHDRLTHSLKVAQVGDALARIILQRNGLSPGVCGQPRSDISSSLYLSLDPYVVQAAAHAHDIGHPPFGHVIEDLLNDILTNKTEHCGRTIGFEGNAQSFRIVTRIANHNTERGLELTRSTLNGMLKYPRNREEDNSKWGYYPDDEEAFSFVRKPLANYYKDGSQTLEAQIMDYADDLTYAIHDVADFYQAGLIPLGRIFQESTERSDFQISSRDELDGFEEYLKKSNSFKFNLDELVVPVEEFFNSLTNSLGFDSQLFSRHKGSDKERVAVNNFTSMLIGRYLERKDLNNEYYVELTEPKIHIYDLVISEAAEQQIEILKHLTKYYVITNPNLMQQQVGQQKVIRELFKVIYQQADPDTLPQSAIPSPFRERLKKQNKRGVPRARFTADMISSMTEKQAVALHKRLCGNTPRSLVSSILG